jgi:biopolymer transport protein ExbD
LEARLSFIFRNRAEKGAFVMADTPVEFKDVAGAMAIMRDAGIEKVGLLTPRAISGR